MRFKWQPRNQRRAKRRLRTWTGAEPLEARRLLAADPIITEFQATNTTTLLDMDGDSSDWIEIRNPSSQPLALDGWFLTDDLTDLTRWQFPANTVLAAAQRRLVFASGKDRTDPTTELHTDFRLSGAGEQLALVRPDGVTITQAFDPYPVQFEDQSYGLAIGRETTALIGIENAIEGFVPSDDSLGTSWTDVGFDASGWQKSSGAAGFEALDTGFSLVTDFSQEELGPEWTIDSPVAPVEYSAGTLYMRLSAGIDTSFGDRGTAPIASRPLPNASATDWEMIVSARQGAVDRGAAGIAVIDGETGQPVLQLEYNARLNFRFISEGALVDSQISQNQSEYDLRIVRDGGLRGWSGYYRIAPTDEWRLVGTILDAEGGATPETPHVGMYARTPSSIMNARFKSVEINIMDERPVYGPEIGLDLDAAMRDKNSSAYLRLPFQIEGDPARFSELSLTTRFDDGFRAYLNGVEVVAENVPIESAFNSAASSDFGASNGVIPIRQFDLSSYAKHLRAGENVLAIHGMNREADQDDFFFSASLLGTEILDRTAQYFATSTPGEPNQQPAAPPPTIVTQQGIFFGSTTLEMELPVDNPNLQIRYTTDGTDPTESSTLYAGPIELTQSAMLQARTFDATGGQNFEPSPPVAGTWIAMVEELRGVTSDVPILVLDTLDRNIPNSSSISLAGVNVIGFDVSRATNRAAFTDGKIDYLGRGGIRDRGSSTGGQSKPNLAFETWGADGTNQDDDANVGLFGFAPESDWVLHAPFTFDRAFIRNQLAYEMANSIGRWAPGTRVVEVYLNRDDEIVEERDYYGLYVLTEKIKQGADRVDIARITPAATEEPDISGGYIWKIDRTDPGEPGFTAGGVNLNWVEPKSPRSATSPVERRATEAQQAWVTSYFNAFRSTTSNADINDPDGYSKYIDVLSWIDHHLISVLGDNVDALNLSTYLFKDRGGKIEYGPQWDFDRSMESADDRDDDPSLWGGTGGTAFFTSNFWGNLFRDPGFWQAYIDRWTELRRDVLSDESLNRMLDENANEVAESSVRNNVRWRASLGRTTSRYASGELDGTWEGEVRHLRAWLLERANFMDSNFAQPPALFFGQNQTQPIASRGVSLTPDQTIRLEGPLLDFFDDTEFVSSEVGAVSARYFAPGDDTLGEDWAKADFDDSAWNAAPLGFGFDSGDDFTELLRTEVQPVEGGTTVLTRIEFQIDNVAAIENLILRMRYDDGFVAYLNGTEIRRQNIRDDELAWNSRARSHADADGVRFEDYNISEYKDQIINGRNVLAIRMINSSATSNDMLMQAALVNRERGFGISPTAVVYYTTDGSDPRMADGSVNPSAIRAQPGQELAFLANTRITARNLDETSDRGPESTIVRTNWSGLTVHDLIVNPHDLMLTEINYHPAAPSSNEIAEGWTEDDFEFVEIYNPGTLAADLLGIGLSDGVQLDDFEMTTLDAKSFGVVVANPAAFTARYGSAISILGTFTGQLNNSGERITLTDAFGTILSSVNYQDSDLWGVAADGNGPTLELTDLEAGTETRGKWYKWRSSEIVHGSPGAVHVARTPVIINEVVARGSAIADAIELRNVGDVAVDLSGFYLSDSESNLLKFPLPAGLTLNPGELRVFTADEFNPETPQPEQVGFGLSGTQGDSVWLVQAEDGVPIRFVDDVHFEPSRLDESWSRQDAVYGRLSPTPITLQAANGPPRIGDIIISEVEYAPQLSDAALRVDPSLSASDLEFIEIFNPSAIVQPLEAWRIRGGVEFNFDAANTLAPGASLVILKFDPSDSENINRTAAFRAHYQLHASTLLVGGYQGTLSDADDRVTLLRAEMAAGDTYRTVEDEVLYDSQSPWPKLTSGSSLGRLVPAELGSLAASWLSGPATPGTMVGRVPTDLNDDGITNSQDIDYLTARLRQGNAGPELDLDGNGSVNEADRSFLVTSLLDTAFGDTNLDRVFDSSDLVRLFQAGGYEDTVIDNAVWATGDFNGDGEFDADDLLLAAQSGAYKPTV